MTSLGKPKDVQTCLRGKLREVYAWEIVGTFEVIVLKYANSQFLWKDSVPGNSYGYLPLRTVFQTVINAMDLNFNLKFSYIGIIII